MAMLQSLTRIAASILCRSPWPWPTGLLGVSRRPGARLEASAGSRLGLSLDHHSGRVVSVDQDLCLATDVYVRYQRAFAGRAVLGRSWPLMRAGQLGFAGKLVGEGIRVSLLSSVVPAGEWNIVLRH